MKAKTLMPEIHNTRELGSGVGAVLGVTVTLPL